MNIEDAYRDAVRRDGLSRDPGQLVVVEKLAALQASLQVRHGRSSRIRRLLGRASRTPVRGLYVWGGVGRGKTFLMDLFFATLALQRKKRSHFHRMMSEVHGRLKSLGETEDPLDRIAADIARDAAVLCFDEFFVSDIGDAMILGRLLDGLFRRGVTLVATSNTPPQELYRSGLQRDRFLPAIELLESHTEVTEISAGDDHRLRLLEQAGTYLTPADDAAERKLAQFFRDVAPGEFIEDRVLDILGRPVHTLRCAKGVAWFAFEEICDGPRSQQDYIEIARWYQTVIVSGVPQLTRQMDNAARRFIALVDEFYERKVKLIVSADAAPGSLYRGEQLQFEFRRTVSRLTEMQSSDYLHLPHLA